MNKINKDFLIFFIFLLMANLSFSATNDYTESYFLKSLSIEFPGKISGLELSAINNFEEREKGLGIGLSYRSNGIKADVYIYNLGFNDITNGIDSELARMSFQRASMDIEALAKGKIYNKLRVLSDNEIKKIGNIYFLSKKYNYIEGGSQKESYLLLTCLKGNFIKIRLTYNIIADNDLNTVGENFLSDLSKILYDKNLNKGTEHAIDKN
ncbi:MAG TPA: hypothetical protein PLN24_02980 [Victivallales bacterium]|nr:hypothetical protein [Victivallales bacterium]HPO90351.1 hypothetical protein [Victivallales bacterium]